MQGGELDAIQALAIDVIQPYASFPTILSGWVNSSARRLRFGTR